MDQSAARGHALDLAVDLVIRRSLEENRVIPLATEFYWWLVGPASISLTFGPVLAQGTKEPRGRNGSAMAQLHDDEEFDIELTAADAKGVEVLDRAGDASDDPSFTSSDENVFTYRIDSENPRKATVVAGLPGSAVGTVVLGSITVTHAVDVVPGDVATVSITERQVRKQGEQA